MNTSVFPEPPAFAGSSPTGLPKAPGAISPESGSAILVTLILTAVMGMALASYLKLVHYQNRSVVRSQVWNGAMPLCEAGIEEALTHLNDIGDGNRAVNGWTAVNGQFYMTRTFNGNRYEVWINSSNQPSITSKGYVSDASIGQELTRTVLVNTTKYGSGMRGIITRNGLVMNANCQIDSFDSEDPAYSTNGRYDAAKNKDNGYAGAISGNVNTGGAGIWGYAGTGPAGSVVGNVGDFAWMASNTGVQPGHYQNDLNLTFRHVDPPFNGGGMSPAVNQTLTITNVTYLDTQTTSAIYPIPVPLGGVRTNTQSITTVSKPFTWSGALVTNTASASSTNYPASGTYVGNVVTRTVVEGHGHNAHSVTYYDYVAITGYTYDTLTYTYNTVTTNATTTTTSYALVTDSGKYQVSSLSMSGQDKLLVTGETVLYVTGDFSMTGQSQIIILPGASLHLYLAGNASLSGNGIMNLDNDSLSFALWGLPTCTSIAMSGNAAFTGIIYAPSANLDMNGSGNTVYDCVGAVISNTADFNGHFHFHYDEKLGREGGKSQFKVAYWSEL